MVMMCHSQYVFLMVLKVLRMYAFPRYLCPPPSIYIRKDLIVWTIQYSTVIKIMDSVCFMFGNCNHCCFCCGHPCTMLGVSLFISCKNKIQCVCLEKKKKKRSWTLGSYCQGTNPGSTTSCLYDLDLGQIILLLCASISSSVIWG